jgi:hypothetical protein
MDGEQHIDCFSDTDSFMAALFPDGKYDPNTVQAAEDGDADAQLRLS